MKTLKNVNAKTALATVARAVIVHKKTPIIRHDDRRPNSS
jgi:hypothetical protein